MNQLNNLDKQLEKINLGQILYLRWQTLYKLPAP